MRVRRLAPVLAGLALAFSLAQTALAAEPDWNPQPDPEDIVFPLPCGQSLVFRRILTHEAVEAAETSLLDDRRIRLGSADDEAAYIDYLRTDFISGSFQMGGRRFFLLGKYEVTRAQYESLMGAPSCPSLAPGEGAMPASSLSWYDATEFTRRLSHHLLATGREALTAAVGTAKVYARLPTETEWEFAARGGLAVSIAEFQAERFPMEGELFAYGWVNDPSSAQGEANPIGLLQPNPLGLYDLYGNVAEMMSDAFRMNKAGRSHGQAGAVILKGGSFQSNPSFVNSSGREETALFDEETAEEQKPRTSGLRVALAGPALPTSQDVRRLADEWAAASRSRLPTVDDPIALIGELRERVSDLELSNGLANVEQSVRTEIADRDEEGKRLLSALLLSVGKSIADIRSRYESVRNRQALIAAAGSGGLGADELDRLRQGIGDDEATIQDLNYFNHELLVRIVDNFPLAALDPPAQALAGELRQRNLPDIAKGVLLGSAIGRRLASGDGQSTRRDVLSLTLGGQ